jgi:hypothetical protein
MAKRRSNKGKHAKRKSKRKEKENASKPPKGPSKQPLPAKLDLAYDRNHPSYYMQDISEETRKLLDKH